MSDVTNAQMMTALGINGAQLTKLGELLDYRSPQTDENGDPRPNTVVDVQAHIVSHYTAAWKSWQKSLATAPAFD